MSELRKIPNVGETTEQDLIAMGYTTIESLKGKSADELYAEECALRGCTLDRCQLYLYRAVEYFVNTENPIGGIGKTNMSRCRLAGLSAWSAVCFPCNAPDVGRLKGKSFGCNIRVMTAAVCMIAA